MKPDTVIILLISAVISGMAIGLSIGTFVYSPKVAALVERTNAQGAIITQGEVTAQQNRLILEAWKKTAAECKNELLNKDTE